MTSVARILTIAGSDSGGGAGVQADLKTFHALHTYGMSVITALTAQNTVGVQGIHSVPSDFVRLQIDSVLDDIGADCVKTGMLFNADIIKSVANALRHHQITNLVVDPVMVSTSGHRLLQDEAVTALLEDLLPLATIVTPNIPEAERMSGMKINNQDTMGKAARVIGKMGPKFVLVKGGHLSGPVSLDILYDREKDAITHYSVERIDSENTHGTGCTYAAAIAAEIGKGLSVPDAVQKAKQYVTKAIQGGAHWHLGKGHGPLNHFADPL